MKAIPLHMPLRIRIILRSLLVLSLFGCLSACTTTGLPRGAENDDVYATSEDYQQAEEEREQEKVESDNRRRNQGRQQQRRPRRRNNSAATSFLISVGTVVAQIALIWALSR